MLKHEQVLAEFDAISFVLLDQRSGLRDHLGDETFNRLREQLQPLRAEAEQAITVESIHAVLERCVGVFQGVTDAATPCGRLRGVPALHTHAQMSAVRGRSRFISGGHGTATAA